MNVCVYVYKYMQQFCQFEAFNSLKHLNVFMCFFFVFVLICFMITLMNFDSIYHIKSKRYCFFVPIFFVKTIAICFWSLNIAKVFVFFFHWKYLKNVNKKKKKKKEVKFMSWKGNVKKRGKKEKEVIFMSWFFDV